MANNQIVYLELPAKNGPAMKSFYGSLFGWTYQDYGPEYAAVQGAGLDAGFHAGSEGQPSAPLAIIETDELENMEQRVREAGGTITLSIFAFPGGRRFHFTDPSGNELAVLQVNRQA